MPWTPPTIKEFVEAEGWKGCVGPGWHAIVRALLLGYEALHPDEIHVDQVKEKFGGLRVYVSPFYPDMNPLDRMACDIARSTCERCGRTEGATETTSSDGWISTLCSTCNEGKDTGDNAHAPH